MANVVKQTAVESLGGSAGGADKVFQLALESMGFTLSTVSQNQIHQVALELLEPAIATGNENGAYSTLAVGNGEYSKGAIAGGAYLLGAYGGQTR